MKKDRLREDKDEIHNLDDLIEAREPYTSHAGEETDSFSRDVEIPESIDVDDALTFPHPKHKPSESIDLMDTPHEEDMDEDWTDQDILPSDYSHGYNEATTADVRDDADELAQDQIHTVDHPSLDQIEGEPEIEVMPGKFTPDEETAE